jgi:hypothetical protein
MKVTVPFTDITIEAGIVYEGFGLGLSISDVNMDGWPDIYVSNDYLSNDLLYINQKTEPIKIAFQNSSVIKVNFPWATMQQT